MSLLINGADVVIAFFRSALFVAAALLALVCVIDWAVRTRRIGPFNSVARFFRSSVDPLIKPVERRVVRAGGLPSSAPIWAFIAVLIGGILLLTFLDFLRTQLITAVMWSSGGAAGLLHLLVSAIFSLLRIAIIVAVVSSWLPVSPYSRWIRWSYRLSDPVLAPLRRVIPLVAGFDISPILGYFLLGIVESGLFHLLGLI